MSLSLLKKANVEKLFKNIIEKSEEITIEESYKARCDIISELTTLLTNNYQHFFNVKSHNLEEQIASCKKSFEERKKSDYYFYRYGTQTEKDYIQEQLYSIGSLVDTFILEKYKPTQKIADEVLLCNLELSWATQSRIMFAIFFNDSSQLCFDLIVKKGKNDYRIESIEKDIKFLSTTTSVEAIKALLRSFLEEEAKIEEENDKRRQLNKKKRVKKEKVKALSGKAMVSKIKSLLDEKGFSYQIYEQYYIIKISLQMKKGHTLIRIPKKDIRISFEILPSLCEKILEADKVNIRCKYHQ